jgi:hypothetical protein
MTTQTTPDEPYALSMKECAQRLHVDVSRLYRNYGAAIRCGKIRSLKVGAAVRIIWRSLLDYIEAETRRAA